MLTHDRTVEVEKTTAPTQSNRPQEILGGANHG